MLDLHNVRKLGKKVGGMQNQGEKYYDGDSSSKSHDNETYVRKESDNNGTINAKFRYILEEDEWNGDNHPIVGDAF